MPIQTPAAAGSDHAEHDDASVIGRSRNEPEVFEILFRRYADQIQRYAARRIGAHAADDVGGGNLPARLPAAGPV
jgi:hypothetical protein